MLQDLYPEGCMMSQSSEASEVAPRTDRHRDVLRVLHGWPHLGTVYTHQAREVKTSNTAMCWGSMKSHLSSKHPGVILEDEDGHTR